MREVTVTMTNLNSAKTVERTIDISNIMHSVGENSVVASCPEVQAKLLKEWIKDRAEAQHSARLGLVSWHVK